jgi:hypothetical protein
VKFAPDVNTGIFLGPQGRRATKLRKRTVGMVEGLLRPNLTDAAPVCCICQHPVEREEIVEQSLRSTKVLVRCHGSEELRTFEHEAFDNDSEMRADALQIRMSRWRWFDPTDTEKA